MTDGNPLVAAAAAPAVDPWAGVWIAEDIQAIAAGVTGGSWVDTSLGAVSAGLDALAFVADPVGSLLQYGVAWIIEHVRPLSEALEWLAGDPAQIAAHAQTWRNVAGSLQDRATDLARRAHWDTESWTGAAADAYRTWNQQQKGAIEGLAAGADCMAVITESAGVLIAGVRLMVRDAIAVVVSRLITYAAEVVATAGLATPVVLGQVGTLCAAWAARISRWLKALIGSLARLRGLGDRIRVAIKNLKDLLLRLRHGGGSGGGGGATRPSGAPDPGNGPRGPRTKAHPVRLKDRPLRRENESADVLAQHGYDVEQNPPPKPNGKEPDYRIEGRYFDCYAPNTDNLDNIRRKLSRKVAEEQADRLILNLDDTTRSMNDIADMLRRKPIANLKEIVVVHDGNVIPFFPFDE